MSGAGEHRCGVVALVGRPNAGKSTLLNALLGERIAITTARAQTTRSPILGVLSRPGAQLVLYDTPGISRGQAAFNRAMSQAALAIAEDADLRVLLLDAAARWDAPEERVAALPGPLLLARTKIDLACATPVPAPGRFDEILELSAATGEGLERFVERITARLPLSPPLYPGDFLTDRPLRFLAAEQVREVACELYRDEIPYALAVEVEQWNESSGGIRIQAHLLVEHERQKGIVVGAGGRMLGRVGTEARRRLSILLGKEVHLSLRVKADRNWSKRPGRRRQLGYP